MEKSSVTAKTNNTEFCSKAILILSKQQSSMLPMFSPHPVKAFSNIMTPSYSCVLTYKLTMFVGPV